MTIVLELDVTAGLVDDIGTTPLEKVLNRRRLSLRGLVGRLSEAAQDPRVVGLVAKLGSASLSLVQAQELADAVSRFGSAGKLTVGWAETFGELNRGTASYLVGTGFQELWLQPSGTIGLMGSAAAGRFVRGALERGHLEPFFAQRYEYKNAADTFMRTSFSEAHREATERVAESAYEQIVDTVARNRHLDPEVVRGLIDRAPIAAAEALERGLVDHVGYRDEVRADLERRFPERPSMLFVSRYRPRLEALHRLGQSRRPVVGVVEVVGQIRSGRSRSGPVGRAAGSDTVTAALRAAARDDRVKAVVLRINSPGGSYVASDTIWREVHNLRDAGKPVVASMGDLAASGGYFVALPCDVIVAEPATLTGSIGVLGGKIRTRGFLEHVGLNVETVSRGAHSLMFSPLTAFSEDEWARLNEWLDFVYEDFTAKVAKGRQMTREAVHEVARGRVWTGADALQRGLVDELGGLQKAAETARARAGLPPDAALRPALRVPLAQRLRPARNSDDPAASVVAASPWALVSEWDGHGALAAALGLPSAGPLLAPLGPLR